MGKKKDTIKIVTHSLDKERRSLAEYWSKENRSKAIPIPGMEITDKKKLKAAEKKSEEVKIDSAPPLNYANKALLTKIRKLSKKELRVFPYSAIGKLYMTFDGANYVGSAFVLGKNFVMTAGHCIFSKEKMKWADNVYFIPQYFDGEEPVGGFTGSSLISTSKWTSSSKYDWRYDMGGIIMNESIGLITGRLGYWSNYNSNRIHSLGYPARKTVGNNFNGEFMWECIGSHKAGDNPFEVECRMTKGASGGPLFRVENNSFYAIGINSYVYDANNPKVIGSPNLGTSAFKKIIEHEDVIIDFD